MQGHGEAWPTRKLDLWKMSFQGHEATRTLDEGSQPRGAETPGQERGLCLTCHTPTTALAIRIMIMTMGSTNAVVVSSPSSNQARIWWKVKRRSTVWFKQEQQHFKKIDGNMSQTTGGVCWRGNNLEVARPTWLGQRVELPYPTAGASPPVLG